MMMTIRRCSGGSTSCSHLAVFGFRRMTAMLRAEVHADQPQTGAAADAHYRDCGARAEAAHHEAGAGAQDFPSLLRGLAIERPNQVWCADITYIPIGRGFLYLVAIIDWASRAVLAWRLSNTMDVSFCRDALEEALVRFGIPEIFNTDQGSQFTSAAFTGMLAAAGIRISMDGRGRWMDNVFIERLWRSLKHEDIYLKGYADGREAHAGVASWLAFYNTVRPHQALATPMTVWHEGMAAGSGCGHDAALGQRCRVAHMPTAATTADGAVRSVISGDRSGQESN
ncbi:putative transposase [Bradyrhizobium sp. JR4.1]|uniref:IS3 family transposase n=1 Tax=unclassified Bradyrhizobium TaxID=2631580 RepID=UPI003396AA40